ncbi:MAG: alanine dehydrogenase [Pseudarcicella sp.]|nr:alanine dehydrogenase [Pseudarcicella sp.]MBP6409753.1 alanine dehydrogenase [Pseudarcicella sp.]
MSHPSSGFKEVLAQTGLLPQEAIAWIKANETSLLIGIPKELLRQEKRIALTPEAANLLIHNGHEIRLQTNAGLEAGFTDQQYADAGVKIVYSAEEVFQADVIIKIQALSEPEFNYLKPNSTLISMLNMYSLEKSYFEALARKKITSIAYEYIQDNVGGLPLVRAMSEIAGSAVMMIAAECLSNNNGGQGVIMGGITGIPPTKVVILGAGTVSEYAARIALSLGAEIKIFDKDLFKLQRLKYNVGQQIFTCTIDTHTLSESIRNADVVIGALRSDEGFTPCIITSEMVSQMKKGALIIDVCIDQGGCFETSTTTTHDKPTFKKFDVIHYCVPNIPSKFAHTSSLALSNIFTSFLLKAGKTGGIDEMIYQNKPFMKGIFCYKGSITNATIAKKFNLNYKDLSLLSGLRF